MSNEITIPTHDARYLKVIQENILKVLGTSPIAQVPKGQAIEKLAEAISDSYVVNDSRKDQMNDETEKITETAHILYNDLMDMQPGRSLDEICYAIRLGCREHFGEFHGLSVKTYLWFVRQYFKSNERNAAISERYRIEKEASKKPELTQEQKNMESCANVMRLYEQFKSTGRVNDLGNAAYDFLDTLMHLDGRDVIPFTAEEKKEMMEESEARLLKEKMLLEKNPLEQISLGKAIKKALSGEGHEYEFAVNERKIMAKKIAIERLFALWSKDESLIPIIKTNFYNPQIK